MMGDAITRAEGPILGIIEGVFTPIVEFDITVDNENAQIRSSRSATSTSVNTGSSISATIVARRKLPDNPVTSQSLPSLWIITATRKIVLKMPFISLYEGHAGGTYTIDVKASGIETTER